MLKFRQFIIESRSRGEAMEDVIITAVNGSPKGNSKYKIPAEAGVRVAQFLKKNRITGKGQVLGADTIDVSDRWKEYFGGSVPAATKTPKTDFTIGKNRISLKTGSAAQLMSGGKNESLATFYTALEKTENTIQPKVVKKLNTMFDNLAPASVASTNLRQAIKTQKDEMVNKANEAHKLMMNELATIFNKNSAFRDAFAYEAMSGEVKFDNSIGACTHFLVTDFDGNNSSLHKVSDSSYVSSIASKMKVSVRFKTTSVKKKVGGKTTKTGEYRYWSAIGLILDKMNEEAEQLMNSQYLTENIVTDFFKRVWNRIKTIFSKVVEYVKERVQNVFNFFEIEPMVSVNTVIRL
jgi:hypothetical protein